MECPYCKFRGLQMDRLLEANAGIVNVRRWRSERDQPAVDAALAALAETARDETGSRRGENLMVSTIAAARGAAIS